MWTWKHHALALALAGASAGAQALDLIDVWQAAARTRRRLRLGARQLGSRPEKPSRAARPCCRS